MSEILPAQSPPEPDVLTSGPAGSRQRSADFEVFYLRELPGLVALARALTGSGGTAEELAQESMIAAYRRWDQVSTYEFPGAWVRRVCTNLSTSLLRRRGVEARALLRLGGRRMAVAELPAADEEFWAAVRKLPRRQAQVLALHYVYDMAVVDVAATLGCSESTVKAHLVRGRAAVAARLGDEGELS